MVQIAICTIRSIRAPIGASLTKAGITEVRRQATLTCPLNSRCLATYLSDSATSTSVSTTNSRRGRKEVAASHHITSKKVVAKTLETTPVHLSSPRPWIIKQTCMEDTMVRVRPKSNGTSRLGCSSIRLTKRRPTTSRGTTRSSRKWAAPKINSK